MVVIVVVVVLVARFAGVDFGCGVNAAVPVSVSVIELCENQIRYFLDVAVNAGVNVSFAMFSVELAAFGRNESQPLRAGSTKMVTIGVQYESERAERNVKSGQTMRISPTSDQSDQIQTVM